MSDIDSNNFNVDLENYQGPLDVLLDLAKAQKVDLRKYFYTHYWQINFMIILQMKKILI